MSRNVVVGRFPIFRVALGFALLLSSACSTGTRVELESLDIQLSPLIDNTPFRDTFVASDGRELGYIHYKSASGESDVAVVYLHGIESHSGWFHLASQRLQQKGYDVYCMDRRGSGINRENRDFMSGHIDSYETLFDDIETFIKPLREKHSKVVLTGLSWGGRLAVAYAITHRETVDGLVLITPGVRADVDVSFYAKLQIALGLFFNPTVAIQLPIQPRMFTETPVYLELIKSDPLRLNTATARFLIESVKLESYIDDRIEELTIPMLQVLAEHDDIINNEEASAVLARAWRSPTLRLHFEDQIHSVQFDAVERLTDNMDFWMQYLDEMHPARESR